MGKELTALEGLEWQPIEAAPKDGSAVLLFGRLEGEVNFTTDEPVVCKAHFLGEWVCVDADYYEVEVINPTHWMPLPAPPKNNSK